MIYLLAFVVLVLAAARATRVIVIDEIAAPVRRWVLANEKKLLGGKLGPTPRLGKLVRCYWCSGFWVSALLVLYTQSAACFAGWLPWQSMALVPVTAFAVAYASAWVLDKEEAANGI